MYLFLSQALFVFEVKKTWEGTLAALGQDGLRRRRLVAQGHVGPEGIVLPLPHLVRSLLGPGPNTAEAGL